MAVRMTFDNGRGLVRGDAFPRRWIVTGLKGRYVTEAWLTVKTDPAVADGSATFQKIITTAAGATGWIEDDGATSGVAALKFSISATNTLALTAGTRYDYDVQVLLSDSSIITVVYGDLVATGQITQDS